MFSDDNSQVRELIIAVFYQPCHFKDISLPSGLHSLYRRRSFLVFIEDVLAEQPFGTRRLAWNLNIKVPTISSAIRHVSTEMTYIMIPR